MNDFDTPARVGDAGESLADIKILEQCGVGPDAVAYRAVRPGGDVVEVRILSDQAAGGERWTALLKRLRLVQLAASPGMTHIFAAQLDAKPPRLVMEKAGETSLPRALEVLDKNGVLERVALAEHVAAAMAAAHTVGLAHGDFSTHAVRIRHDQTVQIDFSGVNAGAADAPLSGVHPTASGRAPELREGSPADMPGDVFALASVLASILAPAARGDGAEPGNASDAIDAALGGIGLSNPQVDSMARALSKTLREAVHREPTSRPSAREIARMLHAFRSRLQGQETMHGGSETAAGVKESLSLSVTNVAPNPAAQDLDQTGSMNLGPNGRVGGRTPTRLFCERLGRYRLLEKIGEGGMGAVYKAEDQADLTTVALKVLAAGVASDRQALDRFRKEARLLAEVRHPNIANLLEINEDQGIHFLVMEYISGTDLKQVLEERKILDERLALEIISEVARALIGAHERAIVHRDVKPANIMFTASLGTQEPPLPGATGSGRSPGARPRVKLLDFGLARHVDQTESLKLTQTGAFLGTPYYMSPEQCTGKGDIAPGTDVYAIGATLFEMLAGRPPFLGDDPMKVATMHIFEPVPALSKFNPAVSEGAVRIVEKCLAKRPEDRFVDAAHLLEAIELFLCGEVSEIQLHPLIPGHDPAHVYSADFEWELEGSPELLWPYVSNTERLNAAVGVPSVEYQTVRDPQHGLRKIGNFRMAGQTITWEEHPFEWIEGRRSGVLREFTRGPFQWFMTVVELQRRPTGGTLLKHSVRIEPRGFVGRCVAAIEVGLKGRRSLDRVYRRIDATLTGKLGSGGAGLTDPFQEAAPLPAARQRRLEQRVDELVGRGVDADFARKLGEFVAVSPAQELARIRPLALARRLDADPERTVEACLHAAQCGLLVVHWDILCPTCRISADVKDTLRAIESHARCEVCDLDFDVDFGNSLELIFRVHPELRDVNLKTYCIGGPEHLPHVVAQVRVAPGERIDLDLTLSEGRYVLRGPQLPYSVPLEVDAIRGSTRGQIVLAATVDPSAATLLTAGRQVLGLRNDYQQELLIRLERTVARKDVLTAAQASSMSLFRELFPGEVLRGGQLMNVATVTLLAAGLENPSQLCNVLGDAQAFEVLQEFHRTAQDLVKRQKGAVVKQVDDRMLAAFDDCESAMRAAVALVGRVVRSGATTTLVPRVGLHRGAALATTLNDRLDYFGKSVNRAIALLDLAGPGEIVLSQQVSSDLSVNELIQAEGLWSEVVCAAGPESDDKIVQRVRPRTKESAAPEVPST